MHTGNDEWAGRTSPLRAVEAEFLRVAPERLWLDAAEVGLVAEVAQVSLVEARQVLLRPGVDLAVRDGVWRVVAARALADREWMLGAVGLAMPALRAAEIGRAHV